jgi:sulfate permease, SulP family
VALVVALGSSFHYAIAGRESNATAILALMASSVAAALAQRTPGEQTATSVLMMLAASAVLAGVLVSLLGVLRCGRLVRFLPYPVARDFLAGTGLLFVAGGFQVLASVPLTWDTLRSPPTVPTLSWTVTAAVAAAFMVLSRVSKHALVTPLVILVSVLIFYLGLYWSGMSFDDARAQDLLFMPVDTAHALLPSLAGVAAGVS